VDILVPYPYLRKTCKHVLTVNQLRTATLRFASRRHFRRILRPNTSFNWKLPPRSRILFASPEVLRRPKLNSLEFDTSNFGTYSKFARKNKILAHSVCFVQP